MFRGESRQLARRRSKPRLAAPRGDKQPHRPWFGIPFVVSFGLLRATSQGLESSYRLGSLESGALLCGGYEAYRELHTPAAISFEHAWFLLLALGRRDEIALKRCAECGGVRLHDLLAKRGAACSTCAPGNFQ
jgi:hypothetical protein